MDVGIADAVWVLFSTLVWLGLAATAATMAVSRGRHPVLWFVLGLVLPVLAILALALFVERDPGVAPELSLTEAAGHHPVARALAADPDRTVEQLERTLASSRQAVAGDLRTLRRLGLAREVANRWSLTEDGRRTVQGATPAGTDGADAT